MHPNKSRQRGDIPVGQLLMIGAILIPLVIGLVIFRVELFTWLVDQWLNVHQAPAATF